jgi:hypothetical protein
MKKVIYLLSAAVALVYLVECASAEDLGPNIFIRIKNPHQDPREVQVVDHVCERLVLDHRLSGHGTTEVELCTRGGKGDISIVDSFSGKHKHHREVLHGMWFEAP